MLVSTYDFPFSKNGELPADIISAMRAEQIYISPDAAKMPNGKGFEIGPTETDVLIRVYRASELRVDGWDIEALYGEKGNAHLLEQGFVPCLPDDALYVRRLLTEQPAQSCFWMVHKPIGVNLNWFIYTVGCDEAGRKFLKALPIYPDEVHAQDLLAVRIPNPAS